MSESEARRGVYVHPNGLCESREVGEGTRISAFARIMAGARIGRNCSIGDHALVENDVILGDGVTIKAGAKIWDGVRLGEGVFVGPNVTFTNDRFPRSHVQPADIEETVVEDHASIGANATILPAIRIGRAAMVGAGAVVTKNVPANAVVVGNPAAIVGYQTEVAAPAGPAVSAGDLAVDRMALGVGGCALWRLRTFDDMRGGLTPIEFPDELPFAPRRSFIVYDVPNRRIRGEHAHRACSQFLIAVHGQLRVMVDDGANRREVILEDPKTGLYVSPMVWAAQYRFDPDTVLLVFASHAYDPGDYIRDYETFLSSVRTPDWAAG